MEKPVMRTNNMKLEALETSFVRLAFGFASTVLLLLFLLVTGFAISSFAQGAQPGQPRTFSSPGEASHALFQAVQNRDEPALEAILGAGKEVSSSSDEEQDKLEREQFSQKYQEMHRLVREPDGNTVLYIGAENWPFSIPLVSKNGEWHFDSDRGKREIRYRRVGENETTAIEVFQEFAMAANASAANADDKESNPFSGYYFRIVGKRPASMVRDRGKKKRGLTLVAYPKEYQSSGVMTFVVTLDGIVYERNLGPGTAKLAKTIAATTLSSWHPAE